MDRPRSAQRAASSFGALGEAIRSGSKISIPSKPAPAAAVSLSSSVPDRHTVAMARRTGSGDTGVGTRRGGKLGEVSQHAVGVGLDAGEQAEGVDRLVDGHAPAVENPAASLSRGAHEGGLQGP